MKKLFVIIVLAILLTGCQSKEYATDKDSVNHNDTTVSDIKDFSNFKNDLVYHDYGTGIKLSTDSKVTITNLMLSLKGESAVICAINLESNKVIKLADFQPKQDIEFTPNSEGVYIIVALTSGGKTIDLTPKAVIETNGVKGTEEEQDDFLLLQ